MTLRSNLTVALSFIVAAVLFVGSQVAFGNVTTSTPAPVQKFEKYVFFATSTDQTVFSTSTTALSTNIAPWVDTNGRIDNGYFVVAGAERVTFFFSRTGKNGNAGTSTFDIDVSPDGTNWYDFNTLVQNLATSTTPTSLSSIAVTGTSTTIASASILNHSFYAVRCNVTETTDGEHSCVATADY